MHKHITLYKLVITILCFSGVCCFSIGLPYCLPLIYICMYVSSYQCQQILYHSFSLCSKNYIEIFHCFLQKNIIHTYLLLLGETPSPKSSRKNLTYYLFMNDCITFHDVNAHQLVKNLPVQTCFIFGLLGGVTVKNAWIYFIMCWYFC